MEAVVLKLLEKLASRGIKLSIEGEHLNCYAQKGVLTQEIKDCIVQNKPKIIEILRYSDRVQTAESLFDARNGTGRVQEQFASTEKGDGFFPGPLVDLEAEAVLDPDIQPSAAIDHGTGFAAAEAILLTGASGFLGAYLLNDLITATKACVYCLIRCRSESDGRERIKNNLLKYGLWSDDFASRIVPLPGDLAQPRLGLGAETFDALCNMIDAVYHSGAMVNFIYPYVNLKESNVRGTEEVIRLACRARLKPLHFVSTVGIFPPTADRSAKVLESDPPPSNWQELDAGYRQSKWVAEKIVTIAGDRGLPVRIYRPGFVTGDSTTGIWNTDDFLPRMIKGCIQLGSAPDRETMIDMVPVDYVSKAIVHLSCQPELRSNVFNIVNPHQVPSSELGHLIAALGYPVAVVSYAEWRNALLEEAKTSGTNALCPLLMMIREVPSDLVPAFDCRHTLEGLQGTQIFCPEINMDLMATYLAYFKNSGFLDT